MNRASSLRDCKKFILVGLFVPKYENIKRSLNLWFVCKAMHSVKATKNVEINVSQSTGWYGGSYVGCKTKPIS